MSIFDALQNMAFNTVTNVMGVEAIWTPSTAGDPVSATVLFNEPTAKEDIADQSFEPQRSSIEFKQGDLPGLYELVKRNKPEAITVGGIAYVAMRGELKYDGKTVIVYLSPDEE